MHKFHIIGIGPGTKDYLLPMAGKVIGNADCLIGAKRPLSLFARLKKEKKYLEGDFDGAILYIKKNRPKKRIAVLVSGDPGFYSFLCRVQKAFKKQDYEVIPGISILQIAFARIGRSWQDAKTISLHGRQPRNLAQEIRDYKKVFLLTDARFPAAAIAARLLSRGINDRRVTVFENLSYPDERITETTLEGLVRGEGRRAKGIGHRAKNRGTRDRLCAMLIEKK